MKKYIAVIFFVIVLGTFAFVQVMPFFRPAVSVDTLYVALRPADMIRDAEIIVLGEVTKIGSTRWNQDNGFYYKDGMPYHEVVVNVQETILGTFEEGDEMILTVLGQSSGDLNVEPTIGDQDSKSRGQQIVVFAERREIAWREPERMPVLTFMGGPNQGILFNEDGYYTSVHGPRFTLEQLVNEVQEVRK